MPFADGYVCNGCDLETSECICPPFCGYPVKPKGQKPGKEAVAAPAEGIGKDYDPEGRLKVKASHRNPVDIADDVAAHILDNNDPPRLFSMTPAAVVLKDGGELVPLDADGWLLYVARRVTFTVPTKGGTEQMVAPPAAVMKLIPAVVVPELPPLDGIATTPYFDREGNLIAADGYHKGTRRLLHTGNLRIPGISAEPSEDEVAQAVKLLTEEWLGDFPFASNADKANAVAVPLTLTGRMFYSLVPLFVFDASTSGSGKGLLVATTSIIVTGEPTEVMELPEESAEQRKKITSALLAGQELIMWDESHVITGRTLAAILTAERYSDRILGGNKLMSVANRFTQVALGNNVQVWGDMKRRVWPSRLVPDTEHPEHRTGFRHPDLLGWARAHRGELLGAVLTIWRNWIAKGRPEADITLGSFERWGRTVGGALKAAGITGFGGNIADWLSYSEEDDGGWAAHLTQLRNRFGESWFSVSEVAAAVEAAYLKRPPVKRDPDKELALQLAYAYRGQREKWHGSLGLARSHERDSESGGYTWTVRQRGTGSGTPKPSSVSPDVQYDAEDTEHPEDANRGSEPVLSWPEGSQGEAAQ
jgi:hypothetical protein